MTDTPPKPKRRRWRWLAAGVLSVFATVLLHGEYLRRQQIAFTTDLTALGATAEVFDQWRGRFRDVPILRELRRERRIAVVLPTVEIAERAIPLIRARDDVRWIQINKPDFTKDVIDRLSDAAPKAKLSPMRQ